MKELSYKQFDECISKLEKIESTLNYTIMNDESLLINHLKSYLMMKHTELKRQESLHNSKTKEDK